METTPASPASAKKGIGLISGILMAVVACLCLLAGLVAGAVVLFRTNALSLTKWQSYTNQEMGFSLSYPEKWVYEEDEESVTFASSQAVLDDGPNQDGAGVVVLSLSSQGLPPSPAEFVNYFIENGEWGKLQSIPLVSELTISGYPAASTELSFLDEVDDATYHLKITAILKKDGYLVLVGVCREDTWSQYQATIHRMVDSVEINGP